MIAQDLFESCVARAALAPTVHNTQPARWARDGARLSLLCDTDVGLPAADPEGRDAALSCGAVLEAMMLALSAHGLTASVSLTGSDTPPGSGRVPVAHLHLAPGSPDPLHQQLERRFTWRGAFQTDPVHVAGLARPDTQLIQDQPSRALIAAQNDAASLQIMQDRAFRRELVSWMRLGRRHPRAALDGMSRAAMQMSRAEAFAAPYVLRQLWPLLNCLGVSKAVTAEAQVTLTAPVIALFHSDISENPIETGRAYLRLCLEAAALGLAGWPMAALSDHDKTRHTVVDRFAIAPDRRLIQAIRFGVPTGAPPPPARRPLDEVLI